MSGSRMGRGEKVNEFVFLNYITRMMPGQEKSLRASGNAPDKAGGGDWSDWFQHAVCSGR